MMVPTRNQVKEEQRSEIERLTEEFIRRGGKVTTGARPEQNRHVGKARASMDVRREDG